MMIAPPNDSTASAALALLAALDDPDRARQSVLDLRDAARAADLEARAPALAAERTAFDSCVADFRQRIGA